MMNATSVAPAFGFTLSATVETVREWVYAGHSDQQQVTSYPSEVINAPPDEYVFAAADREDVGRASAAMSFYGASLRAEGLAENE